MSFICIYGKANLLQIVMHAFIKPMWITAALNAHEELGFTASGKKFGGLDVADEGEDANAFARRHGSVLYAIDEWKQGDVIFTADKAAYNWTGRKFRPNHL